MVLGSLGSYHLGEARQSREEQRRGIPLAVYRVEDDDEAPAFRSRGILEHLRKLNGKLGNRLASFRARIPVQGIRYGSQCPLEEVSGRDALDGVENGILQCRVLILGWRCGSEGFRQTLQQSVDYARLASGFGAIENNIATGSRAWLSSKSASSWYNHVQIGFVVRRAR